MLTQINQLHDYLTCSAEYYPEKVALVFGGKRLTYQDLNNLTDNMAKSLILSGLEKGNRVVVCLENSIETVITFWSVLKAGGVISIISDDLKADKIEYIIQDSGCQFLVSRAKIVDVLYAGKKPISSHLKSIIIVDFDHIQSICKSSYIDFKDTIKNDKNIIIYPKNLDIDLASIIYTSGSTGEPKGVMLTHRNMLVASQSINTYLKNDTNDVILSALPLSFDYGLYQMIMAFSMGARFVLEKDFLLPLQFMRKINEEKVTALPGVPTLFSILGETHKKFSFNTASVRCVTNTGAAVYDHHVDIIKKVFPHANFYSMYGLTECKRCTYLPPEDLERKRGSVGVAIPNTEIYIVDEEGNKLPPNQIGQLVIRGATVMKGYWNRPEETFKKLKDGPLPGEKVLFTGDYGLIDHEGYFYFKGRMDETIKSRGVKVVPKEIEEILNAIKGVKEAAVIGIPDENLGSAIVACIACYPNENINETMIYNECKLKLEKSKLPHRIILLLGLPKSKNGKIDKKILYQTIINAPT